MSPPIRSIEVHGFRVFGRQTRTLTFESLLAIVWGPNSHGKTSLAEAIEFLFTGQIVRRQLMASAQDEFAGALRNAHLPSDESVFVQAVVADRAGTAHVVKRTLMADYGKRTDCETSLEIDGVAATNDDLAALGVVLSQPPLEAPVLAQHTLGYLFSARPTDRALYFKTLLEVTDLEDFRTAAKALETEVAEPNDARQSKLEMAAAVPECTEFLTPVLDGSLTAADIEAAFSSAAAALIAAEGERAPDDLGERIARLAGLLDERRAGVFPIGGFSKQALGGWIPPTDAQWDSVDTFIDERNQVEEEVRNLANLFTEALSLPAVATAEEAVDCVLCGTEGALTPARIAVIRQHVAETKTYKAAETAVLRAFRQMDASIRSASAHIDEACPSFLRWSVHRRRDEGFGVATISRLLAGEEEDLVAPWLAATRRLARIRASIHKHCVAVSDEIATYLEDLSRLTDKTVLQGLLADLETSRATFAAEHTEYLVVERALVERLIAAVDAASQITGWQELIELAADINGLSDYLADRRARTVVREELGQAVQQIDQAKEKVLEDKFSELTDNVGKWWNLLRPNEPTFFQSIKPRPGARRTIDLKAGLSPHADQSSPKFRDVIAVFSQSQLHCLGLALFLARAEHEGSRFVVLDDPILSIDGDYRAYFEAAVVEALIGIPMQVIILTQDQRTWKNLEHRYLDRNVDVFQVSLVDRVDGPVVSKTSDDIAEMLTRTTTLLMGDHLETRKIAGGCLRDAAERFCKEILVRGRRAGGDTVAALSDYDGQNLGQLIPRSAPLLSLDPAHPGKLRALANTLNPANHDDSIPARGELRVALGDLRRLVSDYLQ